LKNDIFWSGKWLKKPTFFRTWKLKEKSKTLNRVEQKNLHQELVFVCQEQKKRKKLSSEKKAKAVASYGFLGL
jgi:cobalamin-dependent methionine synthase I